MWRHLLNELALCQYIPHLTIHMASPVQKYTFTGYTQG